MSNLNMGTFVKQEDKQREESLSKYSNMIEATADKQNTLNFIKFFSDNVNTTKVIRVLQSNDIDVDDEDFMIKALSFENIDELSDYIDMNHLLDVEFIGYYSSMQYLMREDFSLSESMELASDFGHKTEDVNSELLASLHASERKRFHFFHVVLEEILDMERDRRYDELKKSVDRIKRDR